VSEVVGGAAREFRWTPEEFGLERGATSGLEVESPAHSAMVIRKILKGQPGVARDIVVLNAAAALIAAEVADGPRSAARMAGEAIDSGAASGLLAKLVERSHAPA
jgi:anthranilate phosphoribosyltransferase